MMQLHITHIEPIRHRRNDPQTSVNAARSAERFATTHQGRIYDALALGPLSAKEIADRTGLTVVQVDRRTHEMEKQGLIETTGAVRDGCRVWKRYETPTN